MPARRPVAALLLATALGAVGCGAQTTKDHAGDFSGPSRDVATTLDRLQNAARDRDGDEICSRLLSGALVDRITKASSSTCASAVEDALKDVDVFDLRADKGAIAVAGQRATARVTSGTGDRKRPDQLTLVREAGRWKLDGLGRPAAAG